MSIQLPLTFSLKGYELVFDAVNTPRVTRLLREAGEWGAATVSGIAVFIGQAIQLFELIQVELPKFNSREKQLKPFKSRLAFRGS
jgi:shikimate 5-dehydrogenase